MILLFLLFFVFIIGAVFWLAFFIVAAAQNARKKAYRVIAAAENTNNYPPPAPKHPFDAEYPTPKPVYSEKEIDKLIKILSTTKTHEDIGLVNKLQAIKFSFGTGFVSHSKAGENLGE